MCRKIFKILPCAFLIFPYFITKGGILLNSRFLTINYIYVSPRANRPFPAIRLQGEWLEKLGFTIGSRVLVHENYGELVIKLLHPQVCESFKK
jgi:toxic protein SymE